MQDSQPSPFVVTIVQKEAPEVTLADVIFGSFGIVGVLVLAAIVFGGVLAMLLMYWNRRHPPESNHMPSVAPLIPASGDRPSYRVQ